MGSRHWISSSSSPSIFVVANGTRPRVFPPCFPCALVRETCMHRTRRLTLFFLFKSHHDYSNLVPRVESFGLPKRGASLLSTLHPRILLSLRRNQFGISVNRPLSPKEHSVSRFTVKSRSDYIADAGAGRIFTRLKGYIYMYPFLLSPVVLRHHCCHYPERKEGGAKIPISRMHDEPYYALRYLFRTCIRMFIFPLFCPRATASKKRMVSRNT